MNGPNYGAAAQSDTSNRLTAVPDTGPTDAMFARQVNLQSHTIDLVRVLEQRLEMVLVQDDSKDPGEVSPRHATQLHSAIQGRIDTEEWINRRLQSLIDRIGL